MRDKKSQTFSLNTEIQFVSGFITAHLTQDLLAASTEGVSLSPASAATSTVLIIAVYTTCTKL